jgi:CheY-like chemotaxis protein
MTANAYAEDVKASFEAGMNAHIAKPINVPLLISTLNKYKKC